MTRPAISLQAVARRLRDARILREVQEAPDVVVTGVSQDSRLTRSGDLFLAWKGTATDAHDYLREASERGAVAAVVERRVEAVSLPQLQVEDGRLGGALAADEVLGSPWRELFLVGVTGTNGKTTTAVLIRHLLQGVGPCRAVGTLGLVQEDGTVREGTEGLTTPGPVQVSEWLAEMVEDGVAYAVLEASSHALEQRRLDGLRFDAAVFTNLGRDHLDYHPRMEDYRRAKAHLLELLGDDGWAVVNRDEGAWDSMDLPGERTLSVGIRTRAALRVEDVETLPHGSRFRLRHNGEEARVELPLLGSFNVENALAAAGAARVAGLSLAEIAEGLGRAPQTPGRLEVVVSHPFRVLIDFAHTPDALDRVLATLRPLVEGRLLVLFGAGGDRDRGKRPEMARVVDGWADVAFVTSDNPRTEDPEAIMDDLVAGMGETPFHRITDRRAAMAAALEEARPGDLLLLAGKGHETYQVVGRERRPFPEAQIVRELLGRGREEEGS